MPSIEQVQQAYRDGKLTVNDIRERGWLQTVTGRIKYVKQPRGGYLPPKTMEERRLDDGLTLNPAESIPPTITGLTVDYLTRLMTGDTPATAFDIPRKGAAIMRMGDTYGRLLTQVRGLDDGSITAAVRLCGFDSAYRAGAAAYRPVELLDPDRATLGNLRIMVGRTVRFLDLYGGKTSDDLTFDGAYTGVVSKGDGDFLTEDTLWDMKVSRNPPTSKHTLQTLMYWRLGVHTNRPEYARVRYVGIYNPRLNTVWRAPVSAIPAERVRELDVDVLGYDE